MTRKAEEQKNYCFGIAIYCKSKLYVNMENTQCIFLVINWHL